MKISKKIKSFSISGCNIEPTYIQFVLLCLKSWHFWSLGALFEKGSKLSHFKDLKKWPHNSHRNPLRQNESTDTSITKNKEGKNWGSKEMVQNQY